jgi:ribonuclease HI
MALTALIRAYRAVPWDTVATVYSDSQLCVNTIKDWAAGWERRGWERKTGPIQNLDLVKELYALASEHSLTTLKWIKTHRSSRWNEYADTLATTWLRERC